VTAAFWLQLMVAALIVGLIVFSRVAPDTPLPISASPLLTAVALAASAWLTFSAVGLRRGDRAARWMSVAGLAVPLLAGVMGGSVRTTSYTVTLVGGPAADESAFVGHHLAPLVSGALSAFMLVFDLAALALLMTRGARRFFVRPVSP
jgi:hypothetical protein